MRSLDARWWWEAALDDWRAFEVLRREENYPPAVFHLQQAAEKALKALCYSRGLPAFTHSTVEPLRRLGDLGISVEEKLSAAARRLDPHYITARYPSGVGGVPRDFYDRELVEELEGCARSLMSFAESKLSTGGGSTI
jgi:HEPN domain-containing protein